MSDDFLKEIQAGFLIEAVDLLQKAEGLFLSLEKPGDHKEAFSHLKRLAHNFKGSGKAVGLDALSTFAHHLENLLIALDEGRIPLSASAVQVLIESNDQLKSDIERLQQNIESVLNHDAMTAKINAVLNNKSGTVQSANSNAQHEVNIPTIISGDRSEEKPSIEFHFEGQSLFEAETPKASMAKTAVAVAATTANANVATTPAAPVDEYIRIPMKRIDELLDSFGEQVIYLSALDHYKNDLDLHRDDLVRTIFNLKKLAFDIQQSTLALRMVTLKTLFSKLERAIRDASKMTGKPVECIIIGAEQELDKIIVDQLSDPLTHMVRNAVDHGLEDNDDRIMALKNPTGTVTLLAKREGGAFVIEIHDDGKGLDPEKIRAKAIEKNLISADADLDEKEIFDLIFENGFSTKENVSELSGRGVGMNVVKEMILSLKGTYEIDSKKGRGTIFKIKLPLSLSLFNGILFQVNENRYLVPSSQISEIVHLAEVELRDLGKGRKMAKIRDEIMDLVDLGSSLGDKSQRIMASGENGQREMILVADTHDGKTGFLVQKVQGIQRIVQKPLGPEMTVCPGAVGVTILGDGFPAIILDLKALRDLIFPKHPHHRHQMSRSA